MQLDALTSALDSLVAEQAAPYDGPSLVELHRQLARLEALTTAATAAFEAAAGFQADGARNAAAWIATTCHLPKGSARRRVRLARHLRHLPEAGRAWLAGDITGSHVAAIGAHRRPATEAVLSRDERVLVDQARQLRYEHFVTALDYWDQLADPDGTEERDRDRQGRRSVYLDQSWAGVWFGKLTLDPISGSIVAGELDRIYDSLFRQEWSETKARLGREPTVGDLPRTPAQRRADALVEMASRSCGARGTARPAPLFTVLVGYETLHGRVCELADGTVVAPGALVPWLDSALVERAVFGPRNRVEVSEKARLFTGATRRALEIRDRYCTHEFCDEPWWRCQADHIIPFAAGGPTTQENGQLRCGHHNRLRASPATRRGAHSPPGDVNGTAPVPGARPASGSAADPPALE